MQRPSRDPAIEKMVAQELAIEASSSGRSGKHPGQDNSPRPMNPQRLPDLCRDWNQQLQAMGRDLGAKALRFCFYSSRIRSKPTEAISVRKDHLWWLAAPGDSIQLGDGSNDPHLTTVLKVDRVTDRIQFIDPWPDEFFLKENFNALGVKAVDLSISKKEFLRVAEGLITLDTPALPEHYYAAFPDEVANIELRIRFGLAFLTASGSAFAREAIYYLEPAWELARRSEDRDAELLAGGKLYTTLVCAGFDSQRRGDTEMARQLDQRAGALHGLYPAREIFGPIDANDFGRMGHLAGVTRNFDAAAFYLDHAVARDPTDHTLLLYRAAAFSNLGRKQQAIADARGALDLIEGEAAALQVRSQTRDARDGFGHGLDRAARSSLDEDRRWALSTLETLRG